MGLKQVSFVERVSYLRGSHYINYEFSPAVWIRVGLLTESIIVDFLNLKVGENLRRGLRSAIYTPDLSRQAIPLVSPLLN